MPELPEVETIVKGLKSYFLDKKIDDFHCHNQKIIKNYNDFATQILNNYIKDIKRHGKYIFILLGNNKTIVIHLRMTGQILIKPINEKLDKHSHLEIIFPNNKLVYRDIRKFGRFELVNTSEIGYFISSKKLSSDALVITLEEFTNNLKKKKGILKKTLLDQSVIAGLGNIYVDEVLNRVRLSPQFLTENLCADNISQMLKVIKETLKRAISKKGTTFSDYVDISSNKGQFQNELRVYRRQGASCYNCGSKIIKDKIAGRGTHYCPNCQN